MWRCEMSHVTTRARVSIAGLIVIALCGSGCTQPSAFQAPVSKFRDASAVVIQSSKAYLLALNKIERDGYLNQQLEFRRQITRSELNNVQVFSDESIAVRLKALDQLSNYTELLYKIVNSDAPESIKGKA